MGWDQILKMHHAGTNKPCFHSTHYNSHQQFFLFSRKCSYFPLWICMRGYDLRMTIMRGHWRDVEINLYGGCSSKNVFTLMLFCMSMLFFLYNTSEWRTKKTSIKVSGGGLKFCLFSTQNYYMAQIESQIMYLFFAIHLNYAKVQHEHSANDLIFCVLSNHADIETI